MPTIPATSRARALRVAHPDWSALDIAREIERLTGEQVSRQRVESALRAKGGRENSGRRTQRTKIESEKRRAKSTKRKARALERRRASELAEPPGKMQLGRRNALAMVGLLIRAPDGLTVERLIDEIGCSRATLYRYRDDVIAAGIDLAVSATVPVVWRLARPANLRGGR